MTARTKKWLIYGIVITLVAVIGYRVYQAILKNQTKPAAVIKQIPVRTEPVQSRLIQDTVFLTGSVTPEKETHVSAKVTGQVLSVLVKEGDNVSPGQVLAIIESTDLERAQQTMIQANSSYENAKLDLERSQKLFQDGLISQQQLEGARLQFTAAETNQKQAESYLGYLQSQFNSSGAPGDNRLRLVAPFAGVILKKYAEEGSMVGPGSPYPVVTIGQIDRVKVVVSAEERLLAYLKLGQVVTVSVDAWPEPLSGKISNILPQVDPVTRTMTLEVLVANGRRRLLPGMFATVSLSRRAVDRVAAVPLKTILEDEAGSYVYLVQNGRAVQRRVVTGLSDETYIEIISGLQLGETVIVAGQHSLEAGSPVEVVEGAK